MKKYLPILSVVIVVLVVLPATFISWITIFDSEWRNNQVREKIRDHYRQLFTYRQENGGYPDSLAAAGLPINYCMFTYCYDISYQVSTDKQVVTMVSVVNDPFVIFFRSDCPNTSQVDEEHASICADFAFKEDYEGDRTDHPIYMKDRRFFATPSAWIELR